MMKPLTYYNETETQHKTIAAFKKELDNELDSFVGTRKELKTAEDAIDSKAKELYNENQKKRNQEKNEKREEFKKDLALEFNINHDHPKLDLLFEKAWDRGHSGGLSEVKFEFESLSELLS